MGLRDGSGVAVPAALRDSRIVVAVLLSARSPRRGRSTRSRYAEVALHFLLLVLILVTAAADRRDPGARVGAGAARCVLLLGLPRWGVGHVPSRGIAEGALDPDVRLLALRAPALPSALHALLIPLVADLSADPGKASR